MIQKRAVLCSSIPWVIAEGETVWDVNQIRSKTRACLAQSAPIGSLIRSVPASSPRRPFIKPVPVGSGGHPDCMWPTKWDHNNTSLMHLGFNNDVLHVTTLIPERPFQACPHHPAKCRGWEGSILPGDQRWTCFSSAFFQPLACQRQLLDVPWIMGPFQFPPYVNATIAGRQLLFPLLRNSVNFGPCSRLSKSTGDFPLFALSFGAAVIVLHHLLEHFWWSCCCLLRKLSEDFQNEEAFTCWQSDFWFHSQGNSQSFSSLLTS